MNIELKNRLFEEYYDVVEKVYYTKFKNMYLIKEDLMQEGYLQLWKSLDSYDKERESTFRTFLFKSVNGAMLKYLRDKTYIVKPPRGLYMKIIQYNSLLLQGFSTEEAKDISGMTDKYLSELDDAINLIYLDDTYTYEDGNEQNYYGMLSYEDEGYNIVELRDILERICLGNKNEGIYKGIVQGMLEGKTQLEIGEYLGISQMTVSRYKKKLENKYKKCLV